MKRNNLLTLLATVTAVVVAPANADPAKKSKEYDQQPPAVVDQNLNWKRLTVTLGPPLVQGTVSKTAEALKQLKSPLTLCYTRSVTHGAKPTGTADFKLFLIAAGQVSTAHVVPPPDQGLTPDLVSCSITAARRIHFERPTQNGVSVAFQVQFFPEHGQPEPTPSKPKYAGPVKVSTGGQISTSGEPLVDATLAVLHWDSTLKPCGDLARGAPDTSNDLLASLDLRLAVELTAACPVFHRWPRS